MEIRNVFTKGFGTIKKYKYAVLILVIGLFLMAIPSNKSKEPATTVTTVTQEDTEIDEQIEELLMQINGAGKVHVMLTVRSGAKTIYETNNVHSSSGENTSTNNNVIIVTDSNRNQNGLIQQIISPTYQGAVIVCEGADDANVRLAIVEAVSDLTGLGANQISVLKMK